MTATTPVAQPVPESNKTSVVSLLIAVVLGTLLSVAVILGIIYFLLHSGRLQIPSSTAAKPLDVSEATHTLTLEPLLINLADTGGSAYLRVGITLSVCNTAEKTGSKTTREGNSEQGVEKDNVAAIRDIAIHELGLQSASELLQPEGKEQLKKQLKAALAEHNPKIKVAEIYFTEFLVQR